MWSLPFYSFTYLPLHVYFHSTRNTNDITTRYKSKLPLGNKGCEGGNIVIVYGVRQLLSYGEESRADTEKRRRNVDRKLKENAQRGNTLFTDHILTVYFKVNKCVQSAHL